MKRQPKVMAAHLPAPDSPLVGQRIAEHFALEVSRQHLLDFLHANTDNLGEGLYALDATRAIHALF